MCEDVERDIDNDVYADCVNADGEWNGDERACAAVKAMCMDVIRKNSAETIAKNAPIAVRACKKAINDGLQVDMEQAIVIEEKLFGSCFETEDQKEGMGAFLEKRKHEPYRNK